MSLKNSGIIWYQLPLRVIENKLHTDLNNGLTDAQVLNKQAHYGLNVVKNQKGISNLKLLGLQIASPLVLILILAGVITIILREYANTAVIFAVVVINTIIGFVQEQKSTKIFNDLAQAEKHFTPVIRQGEKRLVPVEEIVPGDLIILSAGSLVPADARLIQARNFSVDEAILTGEENAVVKSTREISQITRITDQENMIWRETLVVSGAGLAVVIATGDKTEIGKIASLTTVTKRPETPFQKSIKRLSYFLTIIVVAVTAIIFLLGFSRGVAMGESLLISLAVAVAAIPSGLPIAVTVILAFGVQNILRRGGLVKNLAAVETLGGVDLIMTDKTGTLTTGEMTVEMIVPGSDVLADRQEILTMAIRASEAFVEKNTTNDSSEIRIIGRPIERALLKAAAAINLNEIGQTRTNQIDFLPFDSRRRFAAALETDGRRRRIYITGAPELLLNSAKYYSHNGKTKILTKKKRQFFIDTLNRHGQEAIRFIATGYLNTKQKELPPDQSIAGLIFGGLIGVRDEIRPDSKLAVGLAEKAGARVVMVTGDNELTALGVARSIDLVKKEEPIIISGDELEVPDNEPVVSAINRATIFARMLPEQKLHLLKYFQAGGQVVAMTGDGVNDAPALKHADIGIALGSGSAVAKAASHLILTDNSFGTIIAAIKEGRRILDNLKKVVAYLLSTGFSEIILVGGALLAAAPLPILPLQIIWNNVIGEGLMTFAFSFEPAESDIMKKQLTKRQSKNILTPNLIFLILAISLTTGFIGLLIYFLLLDSSLAAEKIRTIMFVILSIDSLCFAFSLKNLRRPIWQINIFSNRYLFFSLIFSLGILSSTFLIPGLRNALHLQTLTLAEIGLIILLGLANLFIIEIVKFFGFAWSTTNARMN